MNRQEWFDNLSEIDRQRERIARLLQQENRQNPRRPLDWAILDDCFLISVNDSEELSLN